MDQRMSQQVQRALQVPLYRRVRRVEARDYIETFERTDRGGGTWAWGSICFSKDRLVERYFMAVGKMHEPQFSQYMMQLAGVSYLMATVEDIFGEHQLDLQAADQLPQSLRVFYAAVYNTTNQISYTVLRRHGRDITSHMRRVWVGVCRAYLVEARWHCARQTPG
ncbi:alpha-thujene synthase, chloroplastic-like [Nymphaea colorata]|nr:alpha-thujene synthase, chloroplastic-like [Nymphaea colorata]